MTSRAFLAEPTQMGAALQVPYGGEQRSLAELHASRAPFAPQDYAAVRLFFGGGKRGRTKARELAPLVCPGCACRLTLFERSGRPPYFAPTVTSPLHGQLCESSLEAAETNEPALVVPSAQAPSLEMLAAQSSDAVEPVLYTLDAEAADPSARPVADARALLVLALQRVVPAGSRVLVGQQSYDIVAASELQQRQDGDAVAVYGRFTEADWDQDAGRLTLRANPRTVQVWATADVPRALLGYELHETVEAPLVRKPVPFIVFGKLKKLAAVCGIPVVRSASLVLLQPLTFSLRVLSAEQAQVAAALAQELDELLASLPPVASESADSQI